MDCLQSTIMENFLNGWFWGTPHFRKLGKSCISSVACLPMPTLSFDVGVAVGRFSITQHFDAFRTFEWQTPLAVLDLDRLINGQSHHMFFWRFYQILSWKENWTLCWWTRGLRQVCAARFLGGSRTSNGICPRGVIMFPVYTQDPKDILQIPAEFCQGLCRSQCWLVWNLWRHSSLLFSLHLVWLAAATLNPLDKHW